MKENMARWRGCAREADALTPTLSREREQYKSETICSVKFTSRGAKTQNLPW